MLDQIVPALKDVRDLEFLYAGCFKILIAMSNDSIEKPLAVRQQPLKSASTEVNTCVCKMHFLQSLSPKYA